MYLRTYKLFGRIIKTACAQENIWFYKRGSNRRVQKIEQGAAASFAPLKKYY
jgi:hypothetical protein